VITGFTRRLVFTVLWLAVFDQFVPRLLQRLERERYEAGSVFRFENSDLFALGPLVSYLREHPQSDLQRVVFFGNSIIFGYGLAASEATPAQFQRQQPDTKVFNAAFNGAELDSSYLIAKAIVDAVDRLFVLVAPRGTANGMLPSLIPIEESDIRAFALRPPDRVERHLQSLAGVWRLYASRYRLQAALFSTSARQYVYSHKRDIVRRLVAPMYSPPLPPPVPWRRSDDRVMLRAPRTANPPDAEGRRQLRQRHPLLCKFGDLARFHRKRTVFVQVDGISFDLSDPEVAAFNAMFAPFAEVVFLGVPQSLRFDTQHLTPQGAQAVAAALSRHESERRAGRG
jgi:hypothetical protein